MDESEHEITLSQPANYSSFSMPSSRESSPRHASKTLNPPFEEMERRSTFSPSKTDDIVLGQLSYAPATQTTVVTTTTTTTTTFPPFMMKAPKLLHVDPKLYPLAAFPTPASIKRFHFKIGDQQAVFQEADDTEATLKSLKYQQEQLKTFGGKIQNVSASPDLPHTPRSQLRPFLSKIKPENEKSRTRTLQRTTSRGSFVTSDPQRRPSRLQTVQPSEPLTPSLMDSAPVLQNFQEPESLDSSAIVTPELEDVEFPQTLSPLPERETTNTNQNNYRTSLFTPMSDRHHASAVRGSIVGRTHSARMRPPVLDMSDAQDASLPSPSLSPVTAAANIQTKREYFAESQDSSLPSEQPSQNVDSIFGSSLQGVTRMDNFPSFQDIPVMLDAFESMADEMKNYYMYQLLRRCSKSVLHFVAETVNPALKRDFLGELPPELAQNVLKHLDVVSLCRASQVSKQWRRIIETDEKIWRDLFEAEGFCLTEPELKRAIMEGWGWQSDSRLEGREENLGSIEFQDKSPTQMSVFGTEAGSATEDTSGSKRPKRKAAQHSGPIMPRKQRKRGDNTSDDLAQFDTESFQNSLTNIDGPFAAAETALSAMPSADVGLQSLSTLHLYKSLYRRHHLFSQSWMQMETEPRHLAFKAHNLNVVTCLQFDSERIVTGSDDTNINVYDTQTGALKARLEGHDGGVWALQYVGNTLVSGSTDRSVRIWDIERGICTHTFLGHTSTVRCLIILMPVVIGRTASGTPIMMPKEPLIITGSRDSTLRVWKLPKPGDPSFMSNGVAQDDQDCPYLVRTLNGHGHSVRAIAAHGDTLVSGSYDCTVRVWKISTGETMNRLIGHGSKVYSVVLDHEKNRCISGSMDTMVKVWSLDTGNLLYNLEGHTSLVGLLDLQRGRLVSAAADMNLRIWDLDSGVCVKNLVGHNGAITCFQHDGIKIVSGSDRSLKMWSAQTGEFVRDLLFDLSGVWQVKFDERRCCAAVQRNGQTYIEVQRNRQDVTWY